MVVPSRARREKLGFDWAAVPGNLEIMFGPFCHFTGGPSFFYFYFFFLNIVELKRKKEKKKVKVRKKEGLTIFTILV